MGLYKMAAPVNNAAPKLSKNKRLGKNKKKAWRASNVEDLEEFLEDEQRQIRAGGIAAEKPDESLFVVDSGPVVKEKEPEGKKQSKRSKKDKALRCEALLLPDPHSKAVRVKDGDTFQKGKRSQEIQDRLESRKSSKIRLSAKAQSLQAAKELSAKRAKKRQLPTVESDIWAESEPDNSSKVKRPKRLLKKPSALSATPVPHPGASVNPCFEDHQDLLLTARDKEVEKLKAAQRIYNALDAKFPLRANAPSEASYLVEMAAGLVADSDSDSDSDAESGDEYTTVNPPVSRDSRKTKKQKRVKREIADQLKDKKTTRDAKQRENMVLRIPTLKAEIKKQEEKEKLRLKKKQEEEEQMKFKTKRLGKIKFEELDADLKLSDELVGSLREVKPEGHMLKDVYKSLQRRNILEPRIRQKHKPRYKRKHFTKKSHQQPIL